MYSYAGVGIADALRVVSNRVSLFPGACFQLFSLLFCSFVDVGKGAIVPTTTDEFVFPIHPRTILSIHTK